MKEILIIIAIIFAINFLGFIGAFKKLGRKTEFVIMVLMGWVNITLFLYLLFIIFNNAS